MVVNVIEGRVWKFGDNISTDYMMPGFTRGSSPEERAKYCMRAIRPEFVNQVQPGDIIVGGKNYGCGSSRSASESLLILGIGCVIAESFGRIFFRNSVSLGFPVLACPDITGAFSEGDMLRVNFRTGEVRNLNSGKVLQTQPLPEMAMKVLDAGGYVPLLKAEYGKTRK